MKEIQVTKQKVNEILSNMYKNGKSPSERFGLTWDSLSELESNNPQLTYKTAHKCKTA
ncbi:hypothetical protein [Vibrio neonatus]|uniref:hypothetical protein n=1 Tax=Vibrio neonatus TaxID=278860 RepID=UPI0021C3DE10|nr:hypothetical protein [Vibrio neonatus]